MRSIISCFCCCCHCHSYVHKRDKKICSLFDLFACISVRRVGRYSMAMKLLRCLLIGFGSIIVLNILMQILVCCLSRSLSLSLSLSFSGVILHYIQLTIVLSKHTGKCVMIASTVSSHYLEAMAKKEGFLFMVSIN